MARSSSLTVRLRQPEARSSAIVAGRWAVTRRSVRTPRATAIGSISKSPAWRPVRSRAPGSRPSRNARSGPRVRPTSQEWAAITTRQPGFVGPARRARRTSPSRDSCPRSGRVGAARSRARHPRSIGPGSVAARLYPMDTARTAIRTTPAQVRGELVRREIAGEDHKCRQRPVRQADGRASAIAPPAERLARAARLKSSVGRLARSGGFARGVLEDAASTLARSGSASPATMTGTRASTRIETSAPARRRSPICAAAIATAGRPATREAAYGRPLQRQSTYGPTVARSNRQSSALRGVEDPRPWRSRT